MPARAGQVSSRFLHFLAMNSSVRFCRISAGVAALVLVSCSTPTLVQIARRRNRNKKDDVTVKYTVTDWDVLNFTDEVKRKLANRSSFHTGVRFGSAGAQATLGTLAGAAETFGWAASTASGLGIGATYIFGMGQIFDSKAHAAAYEQACEAIKAAEASYYFRELQMGFTTDANGKKIADPTQGAPSGEIPSQNYLTPAGETLYYRTTKILKVLNDALVSQIPNLEDLKEANGESSASGSPALEKISGPSITPPPTPTPPPNGAFEGETPRRQKATYTPTPTPGKDARKLANQIHRDANQLDQDHSQGVITTADSYQELQPELKAFPRTTDQATAKDYLYYLIEKSVSDKDPITELNKWRHIIPIHPVATPAPTSPAPAASPAPKQ